MGSGQYTPVPDSLDDGDTASTDAASPSRLNRRRTLITPLPKVAMLAFCGIRSSEPFLFFVLFPFVNEMLVEYGISTDGKSTGYRAGMLEAALAFGNLSTMMVRPLIGKFRSHQSHDLPLPVLHSSACISQTPMVVGQRCSGPPWLLLAWAPSSAFPARTGSCYRSGCS